jgi:integrase
MKQLWFADKALSGLYKRKSSTKEVWAVKARQRGTGNVVTVTLGRTDVIKPAEARRIGMDYLAQLANGVNPNETKRKQQQDKISHQRIELARSKTLQQALNEYLSLKPLKTKTIRDINSSFSRNFNDWLEIPITQLTREDVLQRFQDIKERVKILRSKRNVRKQESGQPETRFSNDDGAGEAQRACRYLSAVINSIKNDEINGKPFLERNPVDVLKDKKLRKTLKPRERYLSDSELDNLVDEFKNISHSEYRGGVVQDDADFVLLLLLTGLRVEELTQLSWAEVKFEDKVFRAVDTKNHRDHTLPMTASVETILKRRFASKHPNAKYVFASPIFPEKSASMSRTFERVCQAVGFKFSAHDLRRTFATVANEIGIDANKIGAALNHKKKGVTAGYIQTTAYMMRETFEKIEYMIFRKFEIESVKH